MNQTPSNADLASDLIKPLGTPINIKPVDTNMEKIATFLSIALVIIFLPISILFCVAEAFEFERVLVFRLGRLRKGLRGPGIFFFLPCIDDLRHVELRLETYNVDLQSVLTKDSVTIEISAVVFARVTNPTKAVTNVEDYKSATVFLAQTFLRHFISKRTIRQTLLDQSHIAGQLGKMLNEGTEIWGCEVERVEIREVALPAALVRSMAAEAVAKRRAKARVVMAWGEKVAANALLEASTILSASPISFQLRYLQTLHIVSSENCPMYIIPVPTNLLNYLREKF